MTSSITSNLGQFKLDELKSKVKQYKIDLHTKSGKTGKYTKGDYMKAIETHIKGKGEHADKLVKHFKIPITITSSNNNSIKIKTKRPCGPRKNKNNNAYSKDELVDIAVQKGVVKNKSEAKKMKVDELCIELSLNDSTEKKKTTEKKDFKSVCGENNNKCDIENEYCNIHKKKCMKKTKAGQPRDLKRLKEQNPTFVFKDNMFGTEEDIQAHLDYWRKSVSEVSGRVKEKDTPVSDRCGSVNMESLDRFTKCDDDKVCNIEDGECIEKPDNIAQLTLDGRLIVGDSTTLKDLKKRLGGTFKPISKKRSDKNISELVEAGKSTDTEKLAEELKNLLDGMNTNSDVPAPEKAKSKKSGNKLKSSREDILKEFNSCLNN